MGCGRVNPSATRCWDGPDADRNQLQRQYRDARSGGGALIVSPPSSKLLAAYASNPVDAIVSSFLTLGVVHLFSTMLGAFVIRLSAEG